MTRRINFKNAFDLSSVFCGTRNILLLILRNKAFSKYMEKIEILKKIGVKGEGFNENNLFLASILCKTLCKKTLTPKMPLGERAICNYTSIVCVFYRTIYIFLAKCPI